MEKVLEKTNQLLRDIDARRARKIARRQALEASMVQEWLEKEKPGPDPGEEEIRTERKEEGGEIAPLMMEESLDSFSTADYSSTDVKGWPLEVKEGFPRVLD